MILKIALLEILGKIAIDGLTPQSRQYVHLSQDKQAAFDIAKRRDKKPVILTVNALEVQKSGTKCYFCNEKVWLTKFVPVKHIKVYLV